MRPPPYDDAAQHGVGIIYRRQLPVDQGLPTRAVTLAHHYHAAALHIDNRCRRVNVALETPNHVTIALLHRRRHRVPERFPLKIETRVLQVSASLLRIPN